MVINPKDSDEIIKRIIFIRKLGFRNIRFFPVFQSSIWKERDITDFKLAMRKFVSDYCGFFNRHEGQNIFIIDSLKDSLCSKVIKKLNGHCLENKLEDCNSLWVDYIGDFYICERILGTPQYFMERKYKIGNVTEGIDFALRDNLLHEGGSYIRKIFREENLSERDCFICPLSFYFREKIRLDNRQPKQNIHFYCRIMKIYQRSFYRIYEALKDNQLFRESYGLN